jgi:hypothetical protein
MKQNEFKKMLKEAVREVFQEEMKEILLEAVKGNKQPIRENINSMGIIPGPISSKLKPDENIVKNFRANLMSSMMGDDENNFRTFTTDNLQPSYTPPPVNTAGEGSTLPPGEVGLDQIMGLFNR